jgi:preprotein translocase subunit SecG
MAWGASAPSSFLSSRSTCKCEVRGHVWVPVIGNAMWCNAAATVAVAVVVLLATGSGNSGSGSGDSGSAVVTVALAAVVAAAVVAAVAAMAGNWLATVTTAAASECVSELLPLVD